MGTDIFDIVALTILESDDYHAYGFKAHSDGTMMLDEKFVEQIMRIVQRTIRIQLLDMISKGWSSESATEVAVKVSLDKFGAKNQAEFRHLEFVRNDRNPLIVRVTLEINLLHPYHWFPLSFELEF